MALRGASLTATRGIVWGGPVTITQGGTYVGNWRGDGTQPTVRVRTTELVEIIDSRISNVGSQPLLDINQAGARVNILRTRFTGELGSVGKAIYGLGVQSVLIENCDILYTWGVRIDSVQAGGSLIMRKTRGRDIQRNTLDFSHFFQTANNGLTAFNLLCEWNECVNEWGSSGAEDIISIHSTNGATVEVANNYLEGSWPDAPQQGHSGSCVMVEDASHVRAHDNICVAGTNCGMGIASGGDNHFYSNRCVSTGKTPDGQQLAGANIGIYANAGSGGNRVYENTVGWRRFDGQRNDYWLPGSPGETNFALPDSACDERADELAEFTAWLARLSANGITVGVP